MGGLCIGDGVAAAGVTCHCAGCRLFHHEGPGAPHSREPWRALFAEGICRRHGVVYFKNGIYCTAPSLLVARL